MSLATITDRIMQRIEAENADNDVYKQLADEIKNVLNRPSDLDLTTRRKLTAMMNALRTIAADEYRHNATLVHIYEDLGKMKEVEPRFVVDILKDGELIRTSGPYDKAGAQSRSDEMTAKGYRATIRPA